MALYREVAESTLDYCLRELKAESGGFYSAQDADSQGVEGAYYLFTPEEVNSVLGEEAGRHFCNCYDITDQGNFHGKSIPNLLLNTRWNFVPEGYDEYREKLRQRMQEVLESTTNAAPGTVLEAGKNGIDMACGNGTVLRILELQAVGKKRMKAADYLRGNPIQPQK